MLSQAQRTTILELNAQGVSKREIARVLGISRVAVRKVLRSNSTAVPELQRPEKAEPYRQQILELFDQCKGNLVRVHEELLAGGAELSYAALTAFCRRHGIGYAPACRRASMISRPARRCSTTPRRTTVELGGKKRKVQTASAVLCYSRMLFFQCYPTFQRFDCKVFLTEALRYIRRGRQTRHDRQHARGGAARQRTRHGPCRRWPPLGAFRLRVRGARDRDANRSARVERPFWFIENNFLAGRTFSELGGSEQQARQWCDKVNATYKKHIRAVPRELFAVERLHLKPLPAWIPEVYRLHQRLVDIEGYVALHTNRYSVPVDWIGRRVEVRETKDKIEIQLDARRLVTHRASPKPSTSASCWPNTGRRAASGRRVPIRIPRRRPSSRPRPNWPTMWRAEAAQPQGRHACPAATAAPGARVSAANRCWARCARPAAMVSTIWTGWNA
jgi:transposase